ncbi:MAG: glycosyltransferase [Bacteroidales bacterium]
MTVTKNVLICPLDWGLGHAARCVPLIQSFLKAGANVIIAADNRPLVFLRKEFPDLQFIQFPAYQITYQNKGSFAIKMIRSIPNVLLSIYKEHKLLDQLIDKYNIDIVFSDNRFGLWNKKAKCIFMTHQVMIKSPLKSDFFDKLFFIFNSAFIKNFDECWIPDNESEINLSGDLSHKYKLPVTTYFIGPLSRFKNTEATNENKNIDVLVLLSGPEPQRTILEEIILQQLANKKINTVIVEGIPEKEEVKIINDQLTIYSHLETDKLQSLIQQAALILCRSGYSTIMDLAVFGKKAILIPTPGQTEQEYLADYYQKKKYYYTVSQKEFNLDEALTQSKKYTGILIKQDLKIIDKVVNQLITSLQL